MGGTTSVVSSRTKRSSKPEKDSLRKVKKNIVKKKIISKSAVKLESVDQTKGVKSEENATKESDVTHTVVSKKKILMQKKSKLKKQASSVESVGTTAKGKKLLKKNIQNKGEAKSEDSAKVARKRKSVEEESSETEKTKIRKSELDLLDGAILSRRHGRACTKDKDGGETIEKSFKKPVIKGAKEKKESVLSKESLSKLPGPAVRERRGSTSSTLSTSS